MHVTPFLPFVFVRYGRNNHKWLKFRNRNNTIEGVREKKKKPRLINVHRIPRSRTARESGAPDFLKFQSETEKTGWAHPPLKQRNLNV
jgi:hypothetical protein